MAGTKQKAHSALAVHERLGETVKHGAEELRKGTTAEATASGKTFLKQLLGLDISGEKKSHGDHASKSEGKQPEKQFTSSGIEIIDLIVFNNASSEKKKSAEKAPRVEAAMNYSGEMARSSERAVQSEKQEARRDVQEIKAELTRLMQSSKVLEMEFAELSMEQAPVDAGEYHKSFLEWMLIVIRQARQKVEDSGAWLSAVKGKGKKASTDFSVANGKMHQSGERTTIQNAAG